MTIAPGDPLPAVELLDSQGQSFPLARYAGAPLVLYFYPKDDTAGCTREAREFSAAKPEFDAAGVQLLGVSKDSAAKHRKFIDKYGLTVPLATDEGAALEAFGTWIEKTLYGRKYMGIDRATFLFDAGGRLVREWRKVRVPGHVEDVLAAARALKAG